jgi:hypothetical protein
MRLVLILSCAAAVWLSACATPPTPHATTASPPAASPGTPAAPAVRWQFIRSRSYEAQSPGLGVSHRHESAIGWADVYVYDLQRRNWAPGVDDAQFDAHFRSTIDEVRGQAARGTYAELKIGPVTDVRIAGQMFRTVSFQFTRAGKPHESLTFLTASKGQLLKYRMTFGAPVPGNVEAIAREFVESTLRNGPGGPPGRGAAGLNV